MEQTTTAKTNASASSRNGLRALCEGAILVALAQILSYIKLMELPNGGSLTPAMFPIILLAVRWGLKQGLLGGFVFGLLQFLFDGGFALGWQSMLGDYLVAFTLLGLAGVFCRHKWGIFPGIVLGCTARFLTHYVVGATLWAEWMPDEFFNMTMTNPWIYSLLYNGSYMLPNMLLALIIATALYAPMRQYLTGADIQR